LNFSGVLAFHELLGALRGAHDGFDERDTKPLAI
jgi:hypothetical protein